MKERLDVLLVNGGYAESREKAKAMIMAGNVFVNGQREDKAGSTFDVTAAIEREKQIKGWNRKRKEKLIAGKNPNWEDLYEKIL